MKISVIVPCYNEVKFIREIITKIKSKNKSLNIEIIVIDDASDDGTKSELNSLKNESGHPTNHLLIAIFSPRQSTNRRV